LQHLFTCVDGISKLLSSYVKNMTSLAVIFCNINSLLYVVNKHTAVSRQSNKCNNYNNIM